MLWRTWRRGEGKGSDAWSGCGGEHSEVCDVSSDVFRTMAHFYMIGFLCAWSCAVRLVPRELLHVIPSLLCTGFAIVFHGEYNMGV